MARRLVVKLARTLRRPTDHTSPEQVHFHAGPAGQPYACHDHRCQSPALDVGDV